MHTHCPSRLCCRRAPPEHQCAAAGDPDRRHGAPREVPAGGAAVGRESVCVSELANGRTRAGSIAQQSTAGRRGGLAWPGTPLVLVPPLLTTSSRPLLPPLTAADYPRIWVRGPLPPPHTRAAAGRHQQVSAGGRQGLAARISSGSGPRRSLVRPPSATCPSRLRVYGSQPIS